MNVVLSFCSLGNGGKTEETRAQKSGMEAQRDKWRSSEIQGDVTSSVVSPTKENVRHHWKHYRTVKQATYLSMSVQGSALLSLVCLYLP